MPYTGLGIWSRLSHLVTQSRNVPLTEAEISSMVAKTKIAEISVAGPLVLMETQNPSQHSQVVKVPDFDHLHKNVRVWRSMGTTPKSWFHKGKIQPKLPSSLMHHFHFNSFGSWSFTRYLSDGCIKQHVMYSILTLPICQGTMMSTYYSTCTTYIQKYDM